MATINIVLDTRRVKKDGTYPLVFRIRIGRKYSDISSGISLNEEDFDHKSLSIKDNIDLNLELYDKKRLYTQKLQSYVLSSDGELSSKEARSYILQSDRASLTIMQFWQEQVDELKVAGRFGGARVYQMTLSVLSQEMDLNRQFKSIAYKDLIELENKLYKRGMSNNGIGVYMRTFRAICNKAINYELVDYSWYPFRKYKFKKDKKSPRVLSFVELQSYFKLNLPESHAYYRSWLVGKLLFMLRGINIKDLLLLSSDNIQNDRIIYTRAKTGKIYSIKITDEIQTTLNLFESNKTLLGILQDEELNDGARLVETIIQRRKVINTHLKKISQALNTEEPITTYVFRYSYANIAKQLGFTKDLIAEGLGHEYGNSVTGIYLEQFDLVLVDTMNKRVINKVWGG